MTTTTKTYTLQRGNKNQNPAGWEDVISGDVGTVSRRHFEFSPMSRCSDAFRVIDSDGVEYDMDTIANLAIDDLFTIKPVTQ